MSAFEEMLIEMGFKNKDLPKIINYVANFNAAVTANESAIGFGHNTGIGYMSNGPTSDLLPLNLKVLSKIKNFNRVHFVPAPTSEIDGKFFTVSTMAYKASLSKYDLMDLQHVYKSYDPKIIMKEFGEEKFSDVIANNINEHIDDGYEIIIYQVVSSFYLITENTMAPEMGVYSRMYFEKNNKISISDL